MSNSFYHERYCLTKTQEEIIKPLLPAPKSTGRPDLNSLTVFNAILWILSSGAPWRDLPTHFGNWNNIYHKSGNRSVTENFQLIGLLLTGEYTIQSVPENF